MAADTPASGSKLEQHTIHPIPAHERHGRMRDLFTLWIGANIHILTIVTGALATITYGLDFYWAMVGLALGNLVGAVFMALHAAQGPQLGVPQMIQTRGQFGSIGAIFIVAVVIIMYLGFSASTMVLGGQSIHSILPVISPQFGTVAIALASIVATIYGHDMIHAYGRWLALGCGIALVVCFGWIIFVHGIPAGALTHGHFSPIGFLSTVSVAALWQIAYAPYVSDYTRYLPEGSGSREAFWASYWGCVIGSLVPMALGALLGLLVADTDVVATLAKVTGPFAIPIIILFTFGLCETTAIQVYCAVLSIITIAQNFLVDWRPGAFGRSWISLVFAGVALAMALIGAKNFLDWYSAFIELLMCAMAPWTAINLVDYYLIRKGDYHVASFFLADGGIYGYFNKAALGCYFLGAVIQIPFMSSDLYRGPVARALGGADISWIVALLVISPVYYVLARLQDRAAKAA